MQTLRGLQVCVLLGLTLLSRQVPALVCGMVTGRCTGRFPGCLGRVRVPKRGGIVQPVCGDGEVMLQGFFCVAAVVADVCEERGAVEVNGHKTLPPK